MHTGPEKSQEIESQDIQKLDIKRKRKVHPHYQLAIHELRKV